MAKINPVGVASSISSKVVRRLLLHDGFHSKPSLRRTLCCDMSSDVKSNLPSSLSHSRLSRFTLKTSGLEELTASRAGLPVRFSYLLTANCLESSNRNASSVTVSRRWYSTDDRESSDDQSSTDLKGFVVHVPNPMMWLKNKWYTFYIRSQIDPGFDFDEFLVGAKQALSFLTRLIVLKDFDTLKMVATQQAVETVMLLISPWTTEQQQSIEVLVSDISLATASLASISNDADLCTVCVDVLCIAVKRYKSRPLLIQMTVRFCREYSSYAQSDWNIADIREFNVREMTALKGSDQQPK